MNRFDYIRSLQLYLVECLTFNYHFQNRHLQEDLRNYCDKRVEESLFPVALLSIFGALVYNVIAAIIEPHFPLLDRFATFLPFYHLFLSSLLLLALFAIKPGKFFVFYSILSFYFFVSNLAYTTVCKALLQVNIYGTPELFYFLYHNCIGILLLVFYPHHRFFPNAVYTVFSVILSYWMLTDLEDRFLGAFLISLIFGVTFFLKIMIWSIIIYGFKTEFDSRQRMIVAERALLAKEFDLARQIQDSIKPPKVMEWAGYDVHYYALKHEHVGGDWVGIHQDQPGKRLIIVIADAMGKGLQASLVIHAVQSLWAEHISQSSFFEPEKWLCNVNEALFFMGRSAIHMVTLGLVVLNEHGQGIYWSAGHVPLFLINDQERKKVRSVLATGSPLGVFSQGKFEGVSFHFTNEQFILLGSDGVFHKGTRHTPREILNIVAYLQADRGLSEMAPEVQDDKTIVKLSLLDTQSTAIHSVRSYKKTS